MREHFQQELAGLNAEIEKMASLVTQNLTKATQALRGQDKKLAKEVIEADQPIDDAESAISDLCVGLLAREQPVAADLRHIVACLKALSDIERIGDYAVHVAKHARENFDVRLPKSISDVLPEMLSIGSKMFGRSVEALLHADESLARKTAELDKELDSLKKQAYNGLVKLIEEGNSDAKKYMEILILSRLLERLGDHVVHICSWAIYNATGKLDDL